MISEAELYVSVLEAVSEGLGIEEVLDRLAPEQVRAIAGNVDRIAGDVRKAARESRFLALLDVILIRYSEPDADDGAPPL